MTAAYHPGKPTGIDLGRLLAYGFPALVIAAGFACHGIFTVVNYLQGRSLGYDDASHFVFGAVSLAIDIIGVGLFSALAGRARSRGDKSKSRRMMVVVYGSAIFSLLMFYGYNCAQRIEPTQQGRAEVEASRQAKERSERAMADARANFVAELMSSAKEAGDKAQNTRLSTKERDEARQQQELYLKQAGDASFRPVDVAPDPIAVDKDPMATRLAKRIGWSVISVQEILIMGAAILLMLISIRAINEGFHLLAQAQGDTPADLPRRRRRFMHIFANNDAPVRTEISPALQIDLDAQILQWVRVMSRRKPGARVRASDMHRNFMQYQLAMGREPATLTMWGKRMRALQAANRLDWQRDTQSVSPILYLGRELIEVDIETAEEDEPELFEAQSAPRLIARA